MKTDPRSMYLDRIRAYTRLLERRKKLEVFLIALKLILIGAALLLLYRITSGRQGTDILLLGGAALLFAICAVVHEHFIRKCSFIVLLKGLFEREVRALEHEFLDYGDGREFISNDHPYSSDLDLFGPRSIFHFVNRTSTPLGARCLSDWLKAPPHSQTLRTIAARQQAVRELADLVDLRLRIQALGRRIENKHPGAEALPLLLEEPDLLTGKKLKIGAIHILPLATLAAAGLMFAGLFWGFFVAMVLIQIGVNRITKEARHRYHLLTVHNAAVFRAYSRIIQEIENTSFQSPLLRSMLDNLSSGPSRASAHIRSLSTLAAFFEMRRSEILHPLLNSIFLWDLHCVFHLERWRARHGDRARSWLRILGEFEALSSYANVLFSFSGWVLPQVISEPGIFQAEALGHFLIPPQELVCNDVQIQGPGSILIVTGPNMAGKSTFLKTIGVNMVLAQAGGPVCARSCRMSSFKLYTSMKVSDSLDKRLSLFYAELQRLKLILERVREGEEAFYLLDELLKGTNAMDRKAGAEALLHQLVKYKASGAVATHDLELTKIERDYPQQIANYHFDGHVEGDRLFFDFLLKPGRCESFNALALMRKIGIEI